MSTDRPATSGAPRRPRVIALAIVLVVSAAGALWPVVWGRVVVGAVGFLGAAWVGVLLVWLGWHRAVFVPAAAVAGCYLAGLYGRPEVDRISVVEALVVLAVVETTSWLDDASMGLPLSWSASLRRLGLELGIGLPVSLFVALMPTAGPRGLAALVIASVAILGVVFVVRVAAPERHG